MSPNATLQSDDTRRREDVLRLLVDHRSEILTFILAQIRDFGVAEDLLQEVAVVVTEQWQDFQTGTNFLAWVRQIARNKLIARQRLGRRPEFLFSPEALANIERAAERRSQTQLDDLRDCIAKLGQKASALIALRY